MARTEEDSFCLILATISLHVPGTKEKKGERREPRVNDQKYELWPDTRRCQLGKVPDTRIGFKRSRREVAKKARVGHIFPASAGKKMGERGI